MIAESLKEHAHVATLVERLGSGVQSAAEAFGEITIEVDPQHIASACGALKQRGFNRISAVTATDWHPREPRFAIVYHLHRLPLGGGPHERLRLKCWLSGTAAEIDSVTGIWEGANWYEREVFDMFGVNFRNHPNLTRILMPDYWEGHPLRKDFPIHGHKYDYAEQK
jgi:NADH-quinone oxidoreductase subunit C